MGCNYWLCNVVISAIYKRTRYDSGGRLADWIQALLHGQLMQLSQLQRQNADQWVLRLFLEMKSCAFVIPLSVECRTDFAECRPGRERRLH